MTGLDVQGTGFEIVVRVDRLGARRDLKDPDIVFLDGMTARYVRTVQARR